MHSHPSSSTRTSSMMNASGPPAALPVRSAFPAYGPPAHSTLSHPVAHPVAPLPPPRLLAPSLLRAQSMRAPARVPAPGLAAVTTVRLTIDERARVDAAGEGLFYAMHRESLDDVVRDLKERGARAVLVSVARGAGDAGLPPREAARVAAMVREFPRVPAVALLSQLEGGTPHAVLCLGRCGVTTLVDVRNPAGWRELRGVIGAERGAGGLQRTAATMLAAQLDAAPDDCRRFFEQLFGCANRVSTVRMLSRELAVLPNTLMSRFFRARLPAPKRYLAMARLCRAARLFENSGLSVSNISNLLDYSSPQSFGRHVRTMLGLTAVEFRMRWDGEGMLARFRDELVLPYRDTLRAFRPLTAPPGWVGRCRQAAVSPHRASRSRA